MRYAAKLDVDVTFRSRADLIEYLEAIHVRTDVTSTEHAWAILAGLSEYASATLSGLRLTGQGSGQLIDGYPDRLAGLARHAGGTVTAFAEDQECWEHLLVEGHVITFMVRRRPTGAHTPLCVTQSCPGGGGGDLQGGRAHTRRSAPASPAW